MIYHSALPKYNTEIKLNEIKDNFIYKKISKGFTHNLVNGVPEIYKTLDCIYFEPFWEKGFNSFKSQNNLGFELRDVIISISEFIEETNIPIFTIVSKTTTKKLPEPTNVKRAILHNYESNLLIWNADLEVENKNDNFEVINKLLHKYNSIGDFMCGYGNTIIPFAEQNKKFICSDLLPKCISTTYERLNKIN